MRETKAIKEDIKKMQTAKRNAERKRTKCVERLEELEGELSAAVGTTTGSDGETVYYFETKAGFVGIKAKNLNLATVEFEAAYEGGYIRRLTENQYMRLIDGGEE